MKIQRVIWVELICSDLELARHDLNGRPAIHGWSWVIGFQSGVEGERSSSQEHMSLNYATRCFV